MLCRTCNKREATEVQGLETNAAGVVFVKSTGYCAICRKELGGAYSPADIHSLAEVGKEEKREKEREKWLEEL